MFQTRSTDKPSLGCTIERPPDDFHLRFGRSSARERRMVQKSIEDPVVSLPQGPNNTSITKTTHSNLPPAPALSNPFAAPGSLSPRQSEGNHQSKWVVQESHRDLVLQRPAKDCKCMYPRLARSRSSFRQCVQLHCKTDTLEGLEKLVLVFLVHGVIHGFPNLLQGSYILDILLAFIVEL